VDFSDLVLRLLPVLGQVFLDLVWLVPLRLVLVQPSPVSAIVGSCCLMGLALVQHLCQSAVAEFAHPVVVFAMALLGVQLL
jgi:hypothetical protein